MITSELSLKTCECLLEYLNDSDLNVLKSQTDNIIETRINNKLLENFPYKEDITEFSFSFDCLDYMQEFHISMTINNVKFVYFYYGAYDEFDPILSINNKDIIHALDYELLVDLDDEILNYNLKFLRNKHNKTNEEIIDDLCDLCKKTIEK